MFADSEARYDTSPFLISTPQYLDTDPHCEECGRSMITRFGGEQASQLCQSCEDTWKKEIEGGLIEEVIE